MRKLFPSATHRVMILALLLAALTLFPSVLFAQQTGTITGTVFDATGAVVPGAKVVLVNEATKDTRPTVSNAEGYFAFPSVSSGNFTVKVEAKGFKGWEQKAINILPGDKKHLGNIALIVGATNETVMVEGQASQVQILDSGERSATLSANTIDHIALQGRDVTELLKTLPGFNMQTSAGGDATAAVGNKASVNPTLVGIGSNVGNGFNSNGLGRNGQDLMTDGAHVIDPGCNCNATQTVNGDMVAEVKVSTSNFGADSAKGPIVVNAVGKSGSAAFHGMGYTHVRHSALNSNDWDLNNVNLPKQDNKYIYPGGQIGGPIRIPGTNLNKNNPKAFFFAGFELYRQTFPDPNGTLKAIVPTADMRKGIFDPTTPDNAALCSHISGWTPQCGGSVGSFIPTGAGATGPYVATTDNIIPGYAQDPGGKAILNMMPLPNFTPTSANPYNFVLPLTSSRNGYMGHGRVDYNFNENTKLYISYNQQSETDAVPVMLWWQPPNSVPYPANMGDKPMSRTISGNLVHVFSPTLTNELSASLAYLKTGLSYGDLSKVSRSANGYPYKGVFNNGSNVLPAVSTGWWIPGYPMMFEPQADNYKSIKVLPNASDTLTKVIKTHTLKVGVYAETTQNNQNSVDFTNGRMEFSPGTASDPVYGNIGSGNPVANILLGVTSHYYEVNKRPDLGMTYKTISAFATDSWKLTRRLSLDLGMRFDHLGEWTDMGGNGAAVFAQSWYTQDMALPAASRPTFPGMRWHSIDPSVPMSGRSVKPVFMSPRFGMAWDLFGTGKTMIRGGFGAYRFNDQWNTVNAALGASSGFKTYETYTKQKFSSLDQVITSGGAPSGGSALAAGDDQQPLTYTYSFNISQKMPWSSVLEVAYVGNQSKHLSTYNAGTNLDNLNVIPLGAYFGPDVNGNVLHGNPAQVAVLKTPTSDPTNPASWQASPAINDSFENANAANYRPYQGYANGALNVFTHRAYSNYNGLQVSWNRQKGSFFWGLNYTFSKALGISGDKIPNNVDANYGPLGQLDRTHVINATYSYDTPKFVKGNALLGGIVNGWTISGTTSIQSGINLYMATGRGMAISLSHPTACSIPNPAAPTDSTKNISVECVAQWDNKTLLGSPDWQIIPKELCNPSTSGNNKFINGNCFGIPAANLNTALGLTNYQPGPNNFPYIDGPKFFNSDLSVAKTFKISERQNVQFRAAAFNFLNHPLNSFDSNNGNVYKLVYDLQNNKSFYGSGNSFALDPKYGSTSTKFGRRVVELTLKYSF